jgi:hypothetical protein
MLITGRGKTVRKRLWSAYLLLAGVLFAAASVQATSPIEERADPSLPDIAAVQYEPGLGPVIVYNPFLCKQAGRDLCEFYRYHEYGHIALHHHDRNDISREQKEEEADRWAAQHAPRQIVLVAWRFFSAGGGATPVHGDGPTRAARLVDAGNLVAFAGRAPANRGPQPLSFDALAL